MSELRLIKKWTSKYIYSKKPLQIDKYALYEKDYQFIGQIKFRNLYEKEDIVEVIIKVTAYDSFDRVTAEFECKIPRINNKDSNKSFGDGTPILINSSDVVRIVPEIVSYSTLDKTVDYSDANKLNVNRRAITDIFDKADIELLNNQYRYHLTTISIVPEKLEDGIYLDTDGVIKTYTDVYPYEDMLAYCDSEEFKNKKKELTNSLNYMTRELPETLSDSDKRKQYFGMIKDNKKVFYSLIVVCIVVVCAISGGIYSKIQYNNLHKYDGYWNLNGDDEEGYLSINGNKVTFYKYKIDEEDTVSYEILYRYIYYGTKKDNKVTFTKCDYLPYSLESDYDYYDYYTYNSHYDSGDYETHKNYNETYKLKKVDDNNIKMGKEKFSRSGSSDSE